MKNQILISGAATLCILAACNSSGENKETANDSAANNSPMTTLIDPDPTDTIPADGYAVYNSNMETAAIISKTLKADIDADLKDAPDLIPAAERKFKYHAIDLNDDGVDELFVAPMPYSYFCGSGGCTAYLLDANGKFITKFSVTRFPIMLAGSKTNGWSDLVIYSGGANRLIKYGSKGYPSNPSTEPLMKGDVPASSPAILDIFKAAYPAFTY